MISENTSKPEEIKNFDYKFNKQRKTISTLIKVPITSIFLHSSATKQKLFEEQEKVLYEVRKLGFWIDMERSPDLKKWQWMRRGRERAGSRGTSKLRWPSDWNSTAVTRWCPWRLINPRRNRDGKVKIFSSSSPQVSTLYVVERFGVKAYGPSCWADTRPIILNFM